jgi:hypothetical protein
MGLAGQSCLITGSPEFDPPQRTPPFLVELSPPTYQVYTVNNIPGTTNKASIDFEVISEDLGQPVRGIVHIDFKGFNEQHFNSVLITPRTLPLGHLGSNPNVRHGHADFTIPSAVGCHSATLVLSHDIDGLGNPVDTNDSATATWYYQVKDPSNPASGDCVSAPINGDAGSETGAE